MTIEQVQKFTAKDDDFEGTFEIVANLGRCCRIELTVHDNEQAHIRPNGSFYAFRTEDEIDRICAAAKMVLRAIPKKEN